MGFYQVCGYGAHCAELLHGLVKRNIGRFNAYNITQSASASVLVMSFGGRLWHDFCQSFVLLCWNLNLIGLMPEQLFNYIYLWL